ncbi:hypothetical protein INT43_005243, partial [Umbelopsis isabellina]
MGRLQDKQFTGAAPRKRRDKVNENKQNENTVKKLEATFCPPLDPSLVAAIWSDNKNYESSFEMLAMLAKEATIEEEVKPDPTESPAENMTIPPPESRPSMASEIPPVEGLEAGFEMDFLKRCFPDQPTEQLEEILGNNNGDVELAIDEVLRELFMQEEAAEGNDLVEHEEMKDSAVKIKQPGSVISSAENDTHQQAAKKSGGQKARKQANKKQVIWDTGGLHAASTLNGTTPDPLMLAPIERNRWLEFEKEVNELTKQFPRLSRTVINTTVRRFRGNLLECTDQLLRLTNTSGAILQNANWDEVRKMNTVIESAMKVLPVSDDREIKRLAVGAMLEGRVLSIHEPEELSQLVISLVLSRERDREKEQIMIEEQLKELSLHSKKEITFDPVTGKILEDGFPIAPSEYLEAKQRAAQASKEIRAVPEYLLMDNIDYYEDDDPQSCRDIAFNLILMRNETYRKAAEAYRRSKGKGKSKGEGGIAFYYSDEASIGRKMDVAAKAWNMRAARAIIREQRLLKNDDHLLDLHGLTVAEATELVKEGVNQWWSRSTMRAGRTKIKPLQIVTGLGKHSDHGQSRLYPTVLKLLAREGWRVDTLSRGSIMVIGPANAK